MSALSRGANVLLGGTTVAPTWSMGRLQRHHLLFASFLIAACSMQVEGGQGGVGDPDDGSTSTTTGTTTGSETSSGSGSCHPPHISNCPTCKNNADCKPDEYCRFFAGSCGEEWPGSCAARPVTCSGAAPACGCDGKTYDSVCEANRAGISVSNAPGENCAAERLPCSDDPDGLHCFAENEWCVMGELPACDRFSDVVAPPCQELTCECLALVYEDLSQYPCTCTELSSGLLVIECLYF